MKIRMLCAVLLVSAFSLSGMELSSVAEDKSKEINHRSLGDLTIFPVEVFAEIVVQLFELDTSFEDQLKTIVNLRKVNKYFNRLFEFTEENTKFMPKILQTLKLTQVEKNAYLVGAAKAGHVWLVNVSLGSGADINAKDEYGNTPLHLAAREGNQKLRKELLKFARHPLGKLWGCHEVSPDPYWGTRALYLELVKLLIEKGANINATCREGRTPLYEAAREGLLDIVKLLIEKKANINAPSNNGWTPLHVAAGNGNLEVTKILIQNGAQVDVKNKDGETPLGCATKYGNKRVQMEELIKALSPWYKRMSYWIVAHPYKATAVTLATGGFLYAGMHYVSSTQVKSKVV